MKVVILQPSYIPWRGVFEQIYKADLFVFYDDVQYDKRGWRNRNRVKTRDGLQWLTIPVHSRGAQVDNIPIHQIEIDWEQSWSERHLRTLQMAYSKAPYYKDYGPWLEDVYARRPRLLADFTIPLTVEMARRLGIEHTRFMRSSEIEGITGQKTSRLVQILTNLGADHYISGPAARSYIEEDQFLAAGIRLEYMEYNYPEYSQLYPPYDPFVSALDLLLMTGPEALDFIVRHPGSSI
jgi:hypothetical protein